MTLHSIHQALNNRLQPEALVETVSLIDGRLRVEVVWDPSVLTQLSYLLDLAAHYDLPWNADPLWVLHTSRVIDEDTFAWLWIGEQWEPVFLQAHDDGTQLVVSDGQWEFYRVPCDSVCIQPVLGEEYLTAEHRPVWQPPVCDVLSHFEAAGLPNGDF